MVSGAVLRPLTVGRVRIRFFFRRRIDIAVTELTRTPSGNVPVSTPEMTAFDLVRYRKGAGSIDHVATVIAELAERIDSLRLLAVAEKGEAISVVQRLGYLLEHSGHDRLAVGLADLVRASDARNVLLEPGSPEDVLATDTKWRVLVNTTIEVEA